MADDIAESLRNGSFRFNLENLTGFEKVGSLCKGIGL
jgi:hypothetical protein